MSGFLQFRSWLRTSSSAEKQLFGIVTVVVLGLVAWALVPTDGGGGSRVKAEGSAAAVGGLDRPNAGSSDAAVAASAPGASGAGVAASGTGGRVGGGTAAKTSTGANATSSACGALTSTDVGVTATQIKVADILLNLAGAIGNKAVNQASPDVQQQMAQAVIDDINSHGGVACRKLVANFYPANPIDPTSTQNICLQIQQDGVFAVMGGFAFPQGANDCLAQHKIPGIDNVAPTPGEAKQYYPYLTSVSPDPVADFKTAIFGMRDRGFFTAAQGFKKLAILEDDCSQEINQAVFGFLVQAGVAANLITKNEFSCPSGGFANPNDMTNFATQDDVNGITNVVVLTGGGSLKEYSAAAKGQNYKPHYLVSDYQGMLVTATGDTGPDPANFDGTVATTLTRFGESDTPGLTDPATQACVALFARHGLPASYVTGPFLGGGNCNIFGLFAAAATHNPGLTRAGLATGIGAVGRFNEAYPAADSIYTAPGNGIPVKVTGGDFWWTIQFSASCTCWKVIDPTYHSAY